MKLHICPRCKNLLCQDPAKKSCPYCDSDLKKYERTTRIWAVIAVLLMILALAYNARFF